MKASNILKVSILITFLLIVIIPASAQVNTTITDITEDGFIDDAAGGFARNNTGNVFQYAIIGNERGYIEFNISEVPTNSIIFNVYYSFKTQTLGGPGSGDLNITALGVRPSTSATNESVYWNIGNQSSYAVALNLQEFTEYTVNLGSLGVTNLFNNSGWFGLGFYGTPAGGNLNFIFSDESIVNASSLIIEYQPPTAFGYNFTGAFFENGTISTSPLEVVVSGQNFTQIITLTGSGGRVFVSDIPNFVSWSIGSGITRRIRVRETNITIPIFLPEADFSQFAYTIKDYTSRIVANDTFIESKRIINGTEHVIESEIILNTINPIAFSQVLQRTYILDVIFSDNSTFRFGFFATLNDLTPTLLIKRASFSRQVLLSYKFLFVEATRPLDTQIQVIYNSTRGTTTLVEAQLFFRNGTFVQELNDTTENINLNFVGLDNETNYYVDVNMTHSLGTFKQTFPFQGASIFVAFPSLGNSTSTFGGMNGTNIIPVFMIIGSGLMFSAISAPVGALMTIMVAVGLQSIDAISINQEFIATGVVLAFILGFNRVRNR